MTISQEDALWQFVLALYSAPEVTATCLDLQDSYGANVNVLLFACWLATQGKSLQPSHVASLIGAIEDMDTQVVKPLRNVRRFVSAAQGDEAFIVACKTLEIDAEKIVLKKLLECWEGLQRGDTSEVFRHNAITGRQNSGAESLTARCRDNLHCYLVVFPHVDLNELTPLVVNTVTLSSV